MLGTTGVSRVQSAPWLHLLEPQAAPSSQLCILTTEAEAPGSRDPGLQPHSCRLPTCPSDLQALPASQSGAARSQDGGPE